MDLQWFEYIFIGLAATIAGFVNAVAGGGTLITFPVLTAVGLPAVMANVTNTVALCPGYFGATIAQRKDLLSQKKRLWALVPVAIVGGIVGGILLLNSGEKLFSDLVPFLILLASILLAIGEPLKKSQKQNRSCGKTNQFLGASFCWFSCCLWWIFWRWVKRNRFSRFRISFTRFTDQIKCFKTSCCI